MSDRDSDSEQFLKQIRQQLDESENRLDATTRSRLTQIRSAALDSATQPKAKGLWPVPAMALSAAAIVAVVSVSLSVNTVTVQNSSLDDLSLLTINDSFELLNDVEFYQWLEDENSNG